MPDASARADLVDLYRPLALHLANRYRHRGMEMDDLERLTERERQIIYLRFHRELTQSQIAEEIGISQMHVSRILYRTLRTVRLLISD